MIILLASFVSVGASQALACSCKVPELRTVASQINAGMIVVRGDAIRTQTQPLSDDGLHRFWLTIKDAVNATLAPKVMVITTTASTCGFTLAEGEEQVLLLGDRRGLFSRGKAKEFLLLNRCAQLPVVYLCEEWNAFFDARDRSRE